MWPALLLLLQHSDGEDVRTLARSKENSSEPVEYTTAPTNNPNMAHKHRNEVDSGR